MDNPATHTPLRYSDRPPIFKFTGDIDRYSAGPTQFDRAMDEVGTRMISPDHLKPRAGWTVLRPHSKTGL